MNLLQELETSVQSAVEHVGATVVGLGRGWGVGSGVVIAPGRVLTNAHNLRHDETSVTFADGRHATARIAGVDHDIDLAVLDVDTADVTPIEWSRGHRGRPDRARHPRAGESRRSRPPRHPGLRLLERPELPRPARPPDRGRARAHGAAARGVPRAVP